MTPTSYVHCNHIEKGMNFLRIGRGELSNLEPMGKCHVPAVKPLYLSPTLFGIAHLPLSYPTTTLNVLLLVGVVITGEWSVAGLSVLAHMHTPPAGWPSHWQGNRHHRHSMQTLHSLHYAILSIVVSSSCIDWDCWLYFSRSKPESRFLSPWFPCEGQFMILLLCVCVSIPNSGLCNFLVTPLLSRGGSFPTLFVCCDFISCLGATVD